MTSLRARRTEVETISAPDRDALLRAAARDGVLHATDDLVVAGLGVARTVALRLGLADPSAPSAVAAALDAVVLDGDPGPGGTGVVALGGLPFDPAAPGQLVVPSLLCAWRPSAPGGWVTQVGEDVGADADGVVRAAASGIAPLATANAVASLAERPSAEAFERAVARCVTRLRAGEVAKVVLARAATGRCRDAIDAAALAATLHAFDPACDLYAVPANPGRLVGASPELIVATGDGAVTAHPLAGTVALGDGSDDEDRVAWLLASAKNRTEHALVVDDIVARLSPLCETLHAASSPSVVRLSTNARLGTWIDGKLREPLDAAAATSLLAALHPTPAVGGMPRDAALGVIGELEGASRGLWAGPVGWVDADGTSTWTLALRGILVDADRFEAWGGAGIVAASEPADERDETGEKLASVLRVLSARTRP